MNALEMNVLLTKAALFDRWLVRSAEMQAAMAEAWARILSNVSFEVAFAAVEAHYAAESRSIMPADITAFAEEHAELSRDVTAQRLAAERDAWLASQGLTLEEWQRRALGVA